MVCSVSLFLRAKKCWQCVLSVIIVGVLLPSSYARLVPITILCTTDLHGCVHGNDNGGGLLRCATLIQQVRDDSPNVLLFDCGDLFQGTAESMFTEGKIMVFLLNQLEYDAWVLGNHDFDWGISALAELHDMAQVPMLAANMYVPGNRLNPFPNVVSDTLMMVDGVRISIAGLTTPGIPTWLTRDRLEDLQFRDSIETLEALLPRLREQDPDIMLLLVHQGLSPGGDDHANQVREIARRFPDFDIILGGHVHELIPGTYLDDTFYFQADCRGSGVGCMELMYDTVRDRVDRLQYEFLEADDSVPRDLTLLDPWTNQLLLVEEDLQTCIGVAASSFPGHISKNGESPAQRLICRAMCQATHADVAIMGMPSFRGLKEGRISIEDVWDFIPYENMLEILYLTPSEIKTVLEENAAYRKTSHFLAVYGVCYRLHRSASIGQRVQQMRYPDGEHIHPRKRLKCVVSSYALASGGGRFKELRKLAGKPEVRHESTGKDMRECLIEYIKRNSPLEDFGESWVTVVE